MGRMVSGMTCERDIDIALWYGLAASDLHDESVPQHDLHLVSWESAEDGSAEI